MAAFPSLRPSEAPITPGAWPATAHKSLNGSEESIRHGSAEIGRTWQAKFVNITEADFLAILTHYRGQRSGFDSFEFSATTLAADLTPAGFAWIYASPPEVVDQHVDSFTVSCGFRCEPRGIVVAPGRTWRTPATTFRPPGTIESTAPLFRFANQPLPAANVLYIQGGPFLLGYRFSTDVDCTIEEIGIYSSNTTPNNSLGIWSLIDNEYTLLFQDVITSAGIRSEGGFNWIPASSFSGLPSIESQVQYVIAMSWDASAVAVPGRLDPEDFILPISTPPIGRSIGRSAYSIEELPSLDVDLLDYLPDYPDPSDEKSYFTANLTLRTVLQL